MATPEEDFNLLEEEKIREQQVDEFLKKEKEEDSKRELELRKKEIANARAAVIRDNERMRLKMEAVKDIPMRKTGESKQIRKYLFIVLGIVFFGILIALTVSYFPEINFKKNSGALPTCGDGTFYDRCSLTKPYYCAEGDLVKNAILCSCPSNLLSDNGECVSKYFTQPKEVLLKYNLRGKEGEIPFTVYSGIQEYLNTLPRELHYNRGEIPRRDDFKLMKIDDDLQRELLMPIIVEIQNAAPSSSLDQLRIAISLVQNIPYAESEFTGKNQHEGLRLSRYPYQVILEGAGSCEGKSELLTFILGELGYDSAMFYYKAENHEAVGIKCPTEFSLGGSGYCFTETTVPAPISYSTGTYLGITGGRLMSSPQIILLNKGKELPDDLYEFKDAKSLDTILKDNSIDFFEKWKFNKLIGKYGLNYQ